MSSSTCSSESRRVQFQLSKESCRVDILRADAVDMVLVSAIKDRPLTDIFDRILCGLTAVNYCDLNEGTWTYLTSATNVILYQSDTVNVAPTPSDDRRKVLSVASDVSPVWYGDEDDDNQWCWQRHPEIPLTLTLIACRQRLFAAYNDVDRSTAVPVVAATWRVWNGNDKHRSLLSMSSTRNGTHFLWMSLNLRQRFYQSLCRCWWKMTSVRRFVSICMLGPLLNVAL